MAFTNEFKEAVVNKKLLLIRIMMKDSLLLDPSASMFDEMAGYLKENDIDLYDDHDGEVLSYDIADWNEAYMNSQMVGVVNNFSEERVHLLKQMVRHIYKDKIAEVNTKTSRRDENNVSDHNSAYYYERARFTKKYVGMGLFGIGIVSAVAGVCTGVCASEITVAVGAATIGGVVAIGIGAAIIKSDK